MSSCLQRQTISAVQCFPKPLACAHQIWCITFFSQWRAVVEVFPEPALSVKSSRAAALTGSIARANCLLNFSFRVLSNVARTRAPFLRLPTHVHFPMVKQVCHKVFRALIVCELALETGVCCWTLSRRQ